MLRYKTETRPGLVALYDIRPGNGAGQFLQPWSPHGAIMMMMMMIMMMSACELILEMIKYDDKDAILRGLVQLLQPSSDEVNRALFTIMLGHSYTLSGLH